MQENNSLWEKSSEVEEIPYILGPIYVAIKYKTNYILVYFWIWGFVNVESLFCEFCYLDTNIIKYGYTWCVCKNTGEVDIWNRICWARDEENPLDTSVV